MDILAAYNTHKVNSAITPAPSDIRNTPLDLAFGTTTTVAVTDASGNIVSSLSSVGTYEVKYTSTNLKGESSFITLSVERV